MFFSGIYLRNNVICIFHSQLISNIFHLELKEWTQIVAICSEWNIEEGIFEKFSLTKAYKFCFCVSRAKYCFYPKSENNDFVFTRESWDVENHLKIPFWVFSLSIQTFQTLLKVKDLPDEWPFIINLNLLLSSMDPVSRQISTC